MLLPYKHAKYVTYPEVREKEYIITDQGTIVDLVYKRIVRYFLDKDGYMRVTLRVNKRSTGKTSANFGVHRLVAWEFCENDDPQAKTVVNHLDARIMHNEPSNLEWTTVAGNTQHADMHELRHIRGDKNVTSIYSEYFVRQICKLYEEGYMPMDVYHKFYGYEPLHSKADKAIYKLLYSLKKKAAWPDVVAEYNYSTEIEKNRTEKVFAPTQNSLFSEENVRWICERLQSGIPARDVAASVIDGQLPNFDMGDHTPRQIRDAVGRISRGDVWWNIVKDYNLPTIVYDRCARDDRFNESFRQLIDQGLLQSKIIMIVAKEFNVAQTYVRFHLQNYLREHGFVPKYNTYVKVNENTGSQVQ